MLGVFCFPRKGSFGNILAIQSDMSLFSDWQKHFKTLTGMMQINLEKIMEKDRSQSEEMTYCMTAFI